MDGNGIAIVDSQNVIIESNQIYRTLNGVITSYNYDQPNITVENLRRGERKLKVFDKSSIK